VSSNKTGVVETEHYYQKSLSITSFSRAGLFGDLRWVFNINLEFEGNYNSLQKQAVYNHLFFPRKRLF
jgi:hypothetical protein